MVLIVDIIYIAISKISEGVCSSPDHTVIPNAHLVHFYIYVQSSGSKNVLCSTPRTFQVPGK
jgi:hypothetical protein